MLKTTTATQNSSDPSLQQQITNRFAKSGSESRYKEKGRGKFEVNPKSTTSALKFSVVFSSRFLRLKTEVCSSVFFSSLFTLLLQGLQTTDL